jgi:hypothetical protein
MTTAVRELARYRLDRGWTLQELADQMKAAGWPVPMRTLHTALTKSRLRPRPLTMHAIERFVEEEKAAGRLPWDVKRQRAIA